MMSNGHGVGGMGFGGLGMLLFWGVLIVLVVMLAPWGMDDFARRRPDDDASKALSILAERYAWGEISQDEFDQKRLDLTSL